VASLGCCWLTVRRILPGRERNSGMKAPRETWLPNRKIRAASDRGCCVGTSDKGVTGLPFGSCGTPSGDRAAIAVFHDRTVPRDYTADHGPLQYPRRNVEISREALLPWRRGEGMWIDDQVAPRLIAGALRDH